MEYKHKTLGTFNVKLKGFKYLSMSVTNYAEQMEAQLILINKAWAVEYHKIDEPGFMGIKRARYKNILADVYLAPGCTSVVFTGENVENGEGLSRYALEELQGNLEADLISYTKANIEYIRAEFRREYLLYARAKFVDLQDGLKAGLDFINSHLPMQPKFGAMSFKPYPEPKPPMRDIPLQKHEMQNA